KNKLMDSREAVAVQMQEMRGGQDDFLLEETQTVPIPVETIAEMHTLQDLPVETEHKVSEIVVDAFLSSPELLWMLGVVLFLAWQGWKYAGFRRMLKRSRRKVLDAAVLDTYYTLCRSMGMKKRPELYFCGGLPSPLCVGFWKQEIYINSEDREEGDICLILKHELTHCQRKDLWGKGVMMLARAMHFFNPVVHWMAKLAEKDMELSCDLAVMENCGMAEREAYSMAILRTVKEAKSKNMQMSTAFSGGKEELKARFENIFDMTAKRRGIALFVAAALVVCGGTAFVGCAAPQAEEETLTGVVYGEYTEELVHQLYEAKLQYIGDHVGVGRILGLLPLPDGVTNNSEGMELYTSEEPYGVRRHLDWERNGETTYEYDGESYLDDRWSQIHGMIFLALVENAGDFNYSLHMDGADGGMVVTSASFDREMAKKYFGEKDLREFAADEETFRSFVFAINRYFYEGITTAEEIYKLMELEDGAARERMNDMLYGAPADAADIEEQSMSYQMILADSLVYEIAGQKLESSNPVDYIKCTQYDELVKLGEPALREFLSDFAEGNVGDTLEGYIMMFACQDILGEPRQTDLLPTEWYFAYAASDSTLSAPFVYDPMFYTTDMEKEDGLDGSAVKKCSVVAAEQDERLQAVYAALDARFNEGRTAGHQVTFYAPLVQEITEKGNSMSVFAVIFDNSYTRSRTKNGGYALFERGGSVIPSRLDFEKRGGKWILTKWTQARDGSDYTDSIKEMCDGNSGLAKKMISYDSDACQMLLWQNIIYYMKAHYDGMNMPIYFHSYMDEANIQKINQYIQIIPMYE
ncbi:MAG: M56 family metallopeptidase, partial [Anaerotignum sp.]